MAATGGMSTLAFYLQPLWQGSGRAKFCFQKGRVKVCVHPAQPFRDASFSNHCFKTIACWQYIKRVISANQTRKPIRTSETSSHHLHAVTFLLTAHQNAVPGWHFQAFCAQHAKSHSKESWFIFQKRPLTHKGLVQRPV